MTILTQEEFLNKYNINIEDFNTTLLEWSELENIFNHHQSQETTLENVGQYLTNILIKIKGVHSIRYRVKDAEHLIEKIIRKKIEDPSRIINKDNYQSEITDIVGIRAIHLFKEQWSIIHTAIIEKWNLKEPAIVYIREGDNRSIDKYSECGCEIKVHPAGYRSHHYIIETQPQKIKYYCEIQVRTIFEEGWSEIDHKIRYPYEVKNKIYNDFLSILNRLAGSADEMGSFISNLKLTLDEMQFNFEGEIKKKDIAINELQNKIDTLGISQSDKTELNNDINRINEFATTNNSFETINRLIQLTKRQLTDVEIDYYLEKAINRTADDEGWAYIGSVGYYLKAYTPLDYRDLGYTQLKTFIKSRKQLSVKELKKSERAINTDSTFVKIKNK